jgi:hypothetical protein
MSATKTNHMNSSLKLFTQPDVLHQIAIAPLQKFLNQFTDPASGLSSLNWESPYFCSELARLFTQAESLPPPVREILLLLESAASPENCDRLAAIAQQCLPNLCVSEFHPLALALELWLASPDDLSQFHSPALRSASDEGGSSSSKNHSPASRNQNPKGIQSFSPGSPSAGQSGSDRGYPGFEALNVHDPEWVAPELRPQALDNCITPQASIQESTNPQIQQSNNASSSRAASSESPRPVGRLGASRWWRRWERIGSSREANCDQRNSPSP